MFRAFKSEKCFKPAESPTETLAMQAKSSVVDIPWANSFQQTLIVALLRFYQHLEKTISVVQVLTAIFLLQFCYCLCLFYLAIINKIIEKWGQL